MNKVVSTDSQTISVSGNLPYREIGIGGFDTRCDSCCPSVNRMKSISIHGNRDEQPIPDITAVL